MKRDSSKGRTFISLISHPCNQEVLVQQGPQAAGRTHRLAQQLLVGSEVRLPWVQISTLHLSSFGNWGKLLNLYGPWPVPSRLYHLLPGSITENVATSGTQGA